MKKFLSDNVPHVTSQTRAEVRRPGTQAIVRTAKFMIYTQNWPKTIAVRLPPSVFGLPSSNLSNQSSSFCLPTPTIYYIHKIGTMRRWLVAPGNRTIEYACKFMAICERKICRKIYLFIHIHTVTHHPGIVWSVGLWVKYSRPQNLFQFM